MYVVSTQILHALYTVQCTLNTKEIYCLHFFFLSTTQVGKGTDLLSVLPSSSTQELFELFFVFWECFIAVFIPFTTPELIS